MLTALLTFADFCHSIIYTTSNKLLAFLTPCALREKE